MARVYLAFALVLIGLGAGTIVESARMPRFAELGVSPLTAPGLTPALIGAVITLLGLVLCLRSLRSLRERAFMKSATAAAPRAPTRLERPAWRVGAVLALTLGYAGVLVGRVPFGVATATFVFAFVMCFDRDDDVGRVRRTGRALAIAVITAFVVVLVFERVFLVRLPS